MARFISRQNPNFCWEWLGYLDHDGYGKSVDGNGRSARAHRYIYEIITGKAIPPNMVADHKCRNRRCVSPHHIDIITPLENARRASLVPDRKIKNTCMYGHEFSIVNSKKGGKERVCSKCNKEAYNKKVNKSVEELNTDKRKFRKRSNICKKGHAKTPQNTGAKGECITCRNARARLRKKKQRDENSSTYILPQDRTHCKKGHPYDENNTYVLQNKKGRACKKCHENWSKDYRKKKKQERYSRGLKRDANRTHCKKGHEMNEYNIYIYNKKVKGKTYQTKICKLCAIARSKNQRIRDNKKSNKLSIP